MRIKETKILGRKFYVVQSGNCYVFLQGDIEGIIAVVRRCTNRDVHPDNEEYFTVYTENSFIDRVLTENIVQNKVQSYISKLPYLKKSKCYFIERRHERLVRWEIFMRVENENKERIY